MTGKRARACVEGLARRAILGTLQEIQNQKKSCPGTQAVDRLCRMLDHKRPPPPLFDENGPFGEKPRRLRPAHFASMTDPRPGWMETLERALTALARSSDDPVGSFRVLRTLTRNVHEFPHDARYRKVRLENTSFRRRVWTQPGGKEACFALGWHHVPCDDGAPSGVLVLPADAEYRVPDAVVSLLERFFAEARGTRDATPPSGPRPRSGTTTSANPRRRPRPARPGTST